MLTLATAAALTAMIVPSASIAETRAYRVDAQTVHPNGTVLKVSGVRVTPTHTEVTVNVINGHRKPIQLNAGRGAALADDVGNRYRLSPPGDNEQLQVPAGQVMQGVLVFVGPIPDWTKRVLLMFNERGSDDETSSTPRFVLALELGEPVAAVKGPAKKKD